jgi:septal ring factor EnvC (AmiA/AmiB activator)
MSIEAASQRLSVALGTLEARATARLDGLRADGAALREERDTLIAERNQLRESLEQALTAARAAAAAPPPAPPPAPVAALAGMTSAERTKMDKLEADRTQLRATLSLILGDLDSLIARVAMARG